MPLTGKGGHFKIGTQNISDNNDWKLDINVDMKDVTDFDSNNWKEYLAGIKDWSGSVDGYWNISADTTGQKALQDALLGGTSVTAEFDVDETHHYGGTAFIKKISITEQTDDVVKFSADIQGTAALTFA